MAFRLFRGRKILTILKDFRLSVPAQISITLKKDMKIKNLPEYYY
jgi:hypothetical protein